MNIINVIVIMLWHIENSVQHEMHQAAPPLCRCRQRKVLIVSWLFSLSYWLICYEYKFALWTKTVLDINSHCSCSPVISVPPFADAQLITQEAILIGLYLWVFLPWWVCSGQWSKQASRSNAWRLLQGFCLNKFSLGPWALRLRRSRYEIASSASLVIRSHRSLNYWLKLNTGRANLRKRWRPTKIQVSTISSRAI